MYVYMYMHTHTHTLTHTCTHAHTHTTNSPSNTTSQDANVRHKQPTLHWWEDTAMNKSRCHGNMTVTVPVAGDLLYGDLSALSVYHTQFVQALQDYTGPTGLYGALQDYIGPYRIIQALQDYTGLTGLYGPYRIVQALQDYTGPTGLYRGPYRIMSLTGL